MQNSSFHLHFHKRFGCARWCPVNNHKRCLRVLLCTQRIHFIRSVKTSSGHSGGRISKDILCTIFDYRSLQNLHKIKVYCLFTQALFIFTSLHSSLSLFLLALCSFVVMLLLPIDQSSLTAFLRLCIPSALSVYMCVVMQEIIKTSPFIKKKQ